MKRAAAVLLALATLLGISLPVRAAAEDSAQQLLEQVLVLQIGSHAAVVDAGVTSIYPKERAVTAYIQNDRTFVPVRFVAERMGAQVDWDAATDTVIITREGREVRMPIGSDTCTVDGVRKEMDAPAELLPSADGYARTMVPIRFVSEALGYQVWWDAARRMVVVAPGTLTWDGTGALEQAALDEASRLLFLYSMFV